MKNLAVFHHKTFFIEGSKEKLTLFFRDDEAFFKLSDICSFLDIKNPSDAKTRLWPEHHFTLERGDAGFSDVFEEKAGPSSKLGPAFKAHKGGGAHSVTMLTEPGFYFLTTRSDVVVKKAPHPAKDFVSWVTTKVLPSIRKNGSYTGAAIQAELVPAGQMAKQEIVDILNAGLEGIHQKFSVEIMGKTVKGVLEKWLRSEEIGKIIAVQVKKETSQIRTSVNNLTKQVQTLDLKTNSLEEVLDEQTAILAKQEKIIRDQKRVIKAQAQRVLSMSDDLDDCDERLVRLEKLVKEKQVTKSKVQKVVPKTTKTTTRKPAASRLN